jgi:hypothetical protein
VNEGMQDSAAGGFSAWMRRRALHVNEGTLSATARRKKAVHRKYNEPG